MKIIQPSFEILNKIDRDEVLKHLEKCGRTCYKSEDKITNESAPKFVKMLHDRGHHAMLEFFDLQVRFIHNRGFTHEMVRHRLVSYAQESTRYCDYSGELTVIEPWWFYDNKEDSTARIAWKDHIKSAEQTYKILREEHLSPQAARGVLPIDTKTEICVKANLREWMHIFDLRCSDAAHPDMRRIMIPLREEIRKILPEIYGVYNV
jgi:thymidylate synthase (FAD)